MSKALLVAEQVAAGYVRGMPIVHDVSLQVAAGEIVVVIGPNGAGKSTFLKALAGLVHFEGRPGDVRGARHRRVGGA